ncbi:MAG TPA: 40S ribosomal protein S19 [Candidatus Nanoarchaeia archaeon]|nr:40S ribosomal protein S19 [Candidatus Nanoarchaeia archaeon]
MATIYDGNTQESIEKIGSLLKSSIKAPEWTRFVKTSSGKQRTPENPDWYYIRAAAVLVTIYKRGPIGVSKLRVKYGSKENRGHAPERFKRASGKIIRTVLQQLDKAGFTEYKKDTIHKGRIITPKGRSLVDKNTVLKENGKI